MDPPELHPDPPILLREVPRIPRTILRFLNTATVEDLKPHLLSLCVLKAKPVNGHVQFSTERNRIGDPTIRATKYLWWRQRSITEKDLGEKDWYKPDDPITDQGEHDYCWAVASSENIRDARFENHLDRNYISYSHQFLVDFCNKERAGNRYTTTNNDHYCYSFDVFDSLVFAMTHGIATTDDWRNTGCGKPFISDRDVSTANPKHVLNDVRRVKDVKKAIEYLKIQPIIGGVAAFHPEFFADTKEVYRGPTSHRSKFVGFHAVSIRSIKIDENGEAIAFARGSYGPEYRENGYIRISLDARFVTGPLNERMPLEVNKLFREFVYGEVRSTFEKSVIEKYIDAEIITEDLAFLIFEGMYHNTSGYVRNEGGEKEIIGSPIDRSLFKWALQLQSEQNFSYDKSNYTTIKSTSYTRYKGIAVECSKVDKEGIRVHWKGNAEFILAYCNRIYSNDGHMVISEAKRIQLKKAIFDMTEKELICIAFVFKEVEKNGIPENTEDWRLPRKDLILLSIFGIKDPCLPCTEDEKRAPIEFCGPKDDSEELMFPSWRPASDIP